MVNVLFEHHPKMGDIISNRYLKWCFKIPNMFFFLTKPYHHIIYNYCSHSKWWSICSCCLNLPELFITNGQFTIMGNNINTDNKNIVYKHNPWSLNNIGGPIFMIHIDAYLPSHNRSWVIITITKLLDGWEILFVAPTGSPLNIGNI